MRHIESVDNAKLKRVRALARDARSRAREGLTVIEGEHLCRAWLDHGQVPEQALIDDACIERDDIRNCVERLDQAGVELLAVPSRLLSAASSTDSAVPIVCVVAPLPGALARCVGCDCVLLDGVQDPGNVGTILRTAAAAGVRNVISGAGTASIWSPKVLRAAMGAHPVLNLVEVSDLAQAARALGVPVLGTDGSAALSLYRTDLRAPVAWAFGSEGAGLSTPVRRVLAKVIAIPHDAAVESLNVGTAAAVCLFEMRRQRSG